MLWPLFIHDGRNRDGQRALDPCDPSSGHCMRRWLLSEGCVHGALDFLRHAAVLSADSVVRSPFLGCSQRRRRAGACERPRFAEGGKASNCHCRERRICLSKSSCCHVQLRSFNFNSHVKIAISWSHTVLLNSSFAIRDVAIMQHWVFRGRHLIYFIHRLWNPTIRHLLNLALHLLQFVITEVIQVQICIQLRYLLEQNESTSMKSVIWTSDDSVYRRNNHNGKVYCVRFDQFWLQSPVRLPGVNPSTLFLDKVDKVQVLN